jgi:hypothetical protein
MKKDKRISFDDAKSVVKAVNETIKDEVLLIDFCSALCRALPLYHFSVIDGKSSVKENIGIMHLPVRMSHPIHGEKLAYAHREAANDIRNGWTVMTENANSVNAIQHASEKEEVALLDESKSAESEIVDEFIKSPLEEEATPKMTEDRDELIAMAEELGLEVDKRWGVKKLQEAVYA